MFLKNLTSIKNIFHNIKAKFSGLWKNPQLAFTLPLILALVGLCVRILSLAFDNPELRILIWSFGFILFFFLWLLRDEVLAKSLNSKGVQTFMFLFLRLEDIVYSYQGFKGFLVLFSVVFAILHSPAIILFLCLGVNPFVWYWFILLLIGSYYRLRNLFIFPEIQRLEILKTSAYMPFIDHPDKFTWNLVIKNADAVMTKLHGKPIYNKLGPNVGNSPLRYAGIRYMSSWKTGIETLTKVSQDFVELAIKYPKKAAVGVGIVFGTSAAAGGAYLYLENKRVDVEIDKVKNEAQRINIEAQKVDIERTEGLRKYLKDMREQLRDAHLDPEHPENVQLAKNINALDSQVLGLATQNLLSVNNSVSSFLEKGLLGTKLEQAEKSNRPAVTPELSKGPTCVYEEPAIVTGALRKIFVQFESLFFKNYFRKNKIL